MKNLFGAIALFFTLFFSISVSAQTYNYVDDSDEKKEENQKQLKEPTQEEVNALKQQNESGGSLKDKIFFGGGLGFGFSNIYTQVAVLPMVGYMVTDNFQVGLGFVYEYYERKDITYKENNYGIRPFMRYMIPIRDGLRIFPQAEYYGFSNNYKYRNTRGELEEGSVWRDQFLIGGGVSQGIGRKGGVNIIALYDLSWDDDSYYNSPWVIRLEFAF
ncbi:hypothetical protein [Flammeovirga pacifica]|uniref:Outer membrane protein beta-barrel domain-containing protein n=1 Tax=Flammeovirga pacifica TaxID=915059 RepID=A0A1S1Z3F8_FLAPC|nr:hypothetical protein [Flammeovirga pacifica]OHX67615.1 hypothetical protein NH26_15280 [Flammeovirga pacifica]